ncbi:beta-lactamase/transpeptidase-like protein [Cryphonectria parasitica EP155]|uniref:Beta-lactamase/transpeptidase-like protein n=1 Tax=Cryphonectria parasitica (strain ATCC 38755 / EP155) TaxID=660469 RepID=A0A9P4XVB3_CRYP1|nr:beta-lactamase/transpeptidase-like protein [Cryphonectria parasitica EP155]KAF3761487.1 beta-lactamase/transpeptidase-like protein [Cryphonectria parasitica EP155]
MQAVIVLFGALARSANALSQRPFGVLGQYAIGTSKATDPWIPSWTDYIEDVMERWYAPGMAVGVINGSETWLKGFGKASLETSEPVTAHTLFCTGSTTKSFTAASLSLLIDNSSDYSDISWETPISHVLREDFVLSDEWATEHITFEDALCHRTGYPRHDLSILNSTRQLIRSLRYLPLSAEPRTKLQYNNMMYATAGYAIEKLTGLNLASFFHEHLWAPMGMNETFLDIYDPRLVHSGLTAAQSYWAVGNGAYVRNPNLDGRLGADAGAGAVYSNVADYTKYLRVMMAETGPISAAGHRELKRPRTLMGFNSEMFLGPTTETYGLGWMGAVFEGEQIYWHTGTVSTFVTFMLMVPAREYGIVVMANSNSKVRELVTYRVLYDLFGVEQERRPDHEALYLKEAELVQRALDTCPDRLYPNVPNPPLPPSLPLADHAGTYSHPAYGDLFVATDCEDASSNTVDEGCSLRLRRDRDAQQLVVGKLQHKSGDFWLTYAALEELPDLFALMIARESYRFSRSSAAGKSIIETPSTTKSEHIRSYKFGYGVAVTSMTLIAVQDE